MEVAEFDDSNEFLSSQAPDLGVFTGGGMISSETLEMFTLGVLNVHMGILPQYKGMDVVQAAVLENENAGLCAHLMSPALDAGPIINSLSLSPLGYPSLEYLRNTMSAFSPILAFDSLLGLFSGRLECTDQLPLGRQYYVMHPALMDLTNDVLKNQLEKQSKPNDKLSKIFRDVVAVVNAAESLKR